MGLLSSRRLSPVLKVAAFSLLLCLGVGLGWMLWRRFPLNRITDQELLREAVAEWKKAGEPGYGPNYQIFEQQAAQGYYVDAAATGRLFGILLPTGGATDCNCGSANWRCDISSVTPHLEHGVRKSLT